MATRPIKLEQRIILYNLYRLPIICLGRRYRLNIEKDRNNPWQAVAYCFATDRCGNIVSLLSGTSL